MSMVSIVKVGVDGDSVGSDVIFQLLDGFVA